MDLSQFIHTVQQLLYTALYLGDGLSTVITL